MITLSNLKLFANLYNVNLENWEVNNFHRTKMTGDQYVIVWGVCACFLSFL
uniref:Uncharacterized protein n=1 Tax=Rhizophora mucronata TaxID=61149 RepID=A0A2P2PML2_RHIMU